MPDADIYPKVVKISPYANNDEALEPSETWRILFTDPDKKGPRTETIKSDRSTAQLLESTYLTARGTILWGIGRNLDAYNDFCKAIDLAVNHVAMFRRGLMELMVGEHKSIENGDIIMRAAINRCPKRNLNSEVIDTRNSIFEASFGTIATHLIFAHFILTGSLEDEEVRGLYSICGTHYHYALAVWAEINEPQMPEVDYPSFHRWARMAGYDMNRWLKNDKLAGRLEWLEGFLAEDQARQMVNDSNWGMHGLSNKYGVSFESSTNKLPDYTEYLRQLIRDAFDFYTPVKEFTDDREIIDEIFLNTALHSIYLTWGRLPMKSLDELASQLYFVIGDTSHADLYASYSEFRLFMYNYLLKEY